MSTSLKIRIGIIFLFILLVFLHLLPLSLHPFDALNDTEDCLLNTWIPNWVQHQLFKDPLKLFDTNAFYPHTNTLSYSEHLIPQALMALPIRLFTNNPITVYNFIFFFSFFLNAYGMFLLTRYLTRNNFIGILCGIIFAFNSYQINQITHIQLLSSGLIPLTFLYLHKYLEDFSLKNSILFAAFFTLQSLASVYYGLFFISVFFILIPLVLILHRKNLNLVFVLRLGVPFIISSLILALFSLPYLSLLKTYSFDRGLQNGADLTNYLAVDFTNVFLSKILTPLGGNEHFLFPGIAALFFAFFFFYKKKKVFSSPPKILKRIGLVILILDLIAIFLTLLTGGISIDLGILTFSSTDLTKQVLILLFLGLIYALLSMGIFLYRERDKDSGENRSLILYGIIGIWTLLLSFGGQFTFLGHSTGVAPLPFRFFFNFIPGFKGIRVPSRYGVFVIFCIAVLASYGLKYFLKKWEKKKFTAVAAAGLLLFLNLEYLSIPQRMKKVPVKDDIPPAYTWVKNRPKEEVFICLPFFNRIPLEANYLYFSLYHKKRIVNGYSGFFPPVTLYMQRMFKGFPSWPSIDILKSLGVDYVIFHPGLWEEKVASARLESIEKDFSHSLKLIKSYKYEFSTPNALSDFFGEDYIYEVIKSEKKESLYDPSLFTRLQPAEWTATASTGNDVISYLKDNNPETKWSTWGPKKTGDYILIEFEKPVRAAKISLHLGQFTNDFALDLNGEWSSNGSEWTYLLFPYSAGEFTLGWINNPLEPVQNIYFEGDRIKYFKIIHIGTDRIRHWSVTEMEISAIY